jgi:hypothetical protein
VAGPISGQRIPDYTPRTSPLKLQPRGPQPEGKSKRSHQVFKHSLTFLGSRLRTHAVSIGLHSSNSPRFHILVRPYQHDDHDWTIKTAELKIKLTDPDTQLTLLKRSDLCATIRARNTLPFQGGVPMSRVTSRRNSTHPKVGSPIGVSHAPTVDHVTACTPCGIQTEAILALKGSPPQSPRSQVYPNAARRVIKPRQDPTEY